MPIDLASVLKQIGRNNSQNGSINTFYYLVDTADIDFRVEGRIGTVNGETGLLPDFASFPEFAFGQKYIVLDATGIPAEFVIQNGATVIADGDIIEKREDGWYLHLDVSATKTDGGALVYSKHDKKFYYYKKDTGWVELGAGSLTGAAGTTWSIQFRSTDGSLSGDAGLLFNNQTNQLVLGSDVVIAFGDGTTQGTARNFYGVTGPTTQRFPLGMSGAGNTGDRLLIATGPSADPFRSYVKFGTGWFQTNVVGIGQGPQGIQGTAGDSGVTGETGPTGSRGETGYGFTAAFVSGDGNLFISTLFPDGTSGQERSIGFVRGSDGAKGSTGSTGSTGFGFTAAQVSGDGSLYISVLFPDGTSGPGQNIGFVRGATGFTGATGSTGFGFTAAFVSGDGNLFISTLFPDGSSGNERNIGYVRGDIGERGETGTEPGIAFDASWIQYGLSTIQFTLPLSETGIISVLERQYQVIREGGSVEIYLTPYRQEGTDTRVLFYATSASESGGGLFPRVYIFNGSYNVGSRTSLDGKTEVNGWFNPYVLGPVGPQGVRGTTGATGSTGFGFTAAFVSGDGNLYISTLLPSGASGNERSIGFVRGATGATGRFSIGLTVTEQQSYTTHTTQAFQSGVTGTARKVAFLLADGSLTFDYVRNFDVFNRSEFEFAILSFSTTNFATTRLLSNSFYDLSSSTFNASYRLGPPSTASISSTEISPSDFFFPTGAMTSVSGVGISLTGTGGVNRSTTLTLDAEGQDADGTTRSQTTSITVSFRNDYLIGMTAASVITGGGAGTTGINGTWMQRDYTSFPGAASETLSGYTRSVTAALSENYIYFGYPSRLHNETSPPQFYLYPVGSAPGFPGGMVLQGFGNAFDEGGLSTINYTNSEGYVEPYKVWRSDQSYAQNVNMVVKVG